MAVDVQAMKRAVASCGEALGALEAVLRQEQDSLKQRETEGFETLLTRKLEALQDVERLDVERRQLVAAAGLTADPTGMNAYLERCDDAELSQSWARLTAQLAEVQQLNEFNGTLIGKGLSQVERNLSVLLGEGRREAATYDTSGRTQGARPGREISRA